MYYNHPKITGWGNWWGELRVDIGIRNTIYTYSMPITAWIERILYKKYMTFADLEKIKRNAQVIKKVELNSGEGHKETES